MSRLFPLVILSFFIFGCASEVEPDHPVDTVKHDPVKIDTAKVDTGTVTIDTNTTVLHVYDCSVLTKKIPKLDNDAQIQKDMISLGHCGVDSFEILYVVPNLFPGYAAEQQTLGNTVTYNDFLKHMHEFELTDSYVKLKAQVKTLDSLRLVKYDPQNVYTMKPVLGKLGFTATEWDMFQGFVKTYPIPSKNYTWGQLLDDFEKYSAKNPE